MQYKLTYARVVILERFFDVPVGNPDEMYDWANRIAIDMEKELELGLNYHNDDGDTLTIAEGSSLVSVDDYDVIWEVEEA